MKCLNFELQSFKAYNLKDMQAQHELNAILLQNLAHTSSNVVGRTYIRMKETRNKKNSNQVPLVNLEKKEATTLAQPHPHRHLDT